MPPKPFPYPLGVGVDICKIDRVQNILEDHHKSQRWAQKVFNRLEWPDLSFQWRGRPFEKFRSTLELPGVGDANKRQLATYLAGRWAAKEAIIKAHRYRRLYMSEISIVHDSSTQNHLNNHATSRVHALVDPPVRTITMSEMVAALRGLRGQNRAKRVSGASLELGEEDDTPSTTSNGRVIKRRTLVQEEDKQIAEVNLSHDGGFAIAVCMALNNVDDDFGMRVTESIVDDGSGNPVHEPTWGDRGFLENAALGNEG